MSYRIARVTGIATYETLFSLSIPFLYKAGSMVQRFRLPGFSRNLLMVSGALQEELALARGIAKFKAVQMSSLSNVYELTLHAYYSPMDSCGVSIFFWQLAYIFPLIYMAVYLINSVVFAHSICPFYFLCISMLASRFFWMLVAL